MKRLAKTLFKNPLISGSSIIFIGSMLASILGYLFNLAMGRLLLPDEYGLLTSLTSLVILFGVFQISLVGIFAKFAAVYRANEDEKGFAALIYKGGRFTLLSGLVLFSILLLSLIFMPSFLKVTDLRLLILIYGTIFFSFISAFSLGILQGEMRFYLLSFLNFLGPLLKLALGVGAVLVGFKLIGIMNGILISSILPFIIGVGAILKKHKITSVKHNKEESVFITEFKKYGLLFFIATLGISIISNSDIILVRHFFTPTISGQYAALSLMGKAIFYFTSPIYFVFFPLIAHKFEKKEPVTNTLILAGLIVSIVSVGLSTIYFIFPQIVLHIFYPAKAYRMLIPYLGPFSIYIFIFSLAYLFNNFFLSIGRTGIYKINIITAILFIVMITIFHNSLFQIIEILLLVSIVLLIIYIIYFKINSKKGNLR